MNKSKDVAAISNQEMTREEALTVINTIEEELSAHGDIEMEYKLDRALCALGVYKQPDPITGLVPCGCGGKAKYIEEYDDDNVFWAHENYVGCPDCYASSAHITTSKHGYSKAMEAEIKLKLKNAWNTAMGYTAPPRPGAIWPDTGEMAPNGDENA